MGEAHSPETYKTRMALSPLHRRAHSVEYHFQRLSIAVQRGNTGTVPGTAGTPARGISSETDHSIFPF